MCPNPTSKPRGGIAAAVLSLACLLSASEALPQAPPLSREYVYAGERLLAVVAPPQIVIDDIAVLEGQSGLRSATFTISLTGTWPQPITVNFETANGTATRDIDYVPATGVVTFPPNTTSRALSVSVIGDTAVEALETFFVNLTSASGATIGDTQGQATIVDDEATRFVPIDPCRVADTRTTTPLAANTSRTFPVAGTCGVPTTARSVALVVTTTAQSGLGDIRVYPAPGPAPLASVVNFAANKPRAGNMIVPLGQDGRVGVLCDMVSGQTHVILDVMGYFQ